MKRKLKKEYQELLRLDRSEIKLITYDYGIYWKGIYNGKSTATLATCFKTEQEAIEWADKFCEPVEDLESCITRLSNEYDDYDSEINSHTFYGFLEDVYKGDWQEEIKQAVLNSK